MKIQKVKIGTNYKPFIIGEVSGNHKGSLKRAIQIIKQLKKAGASSCKLQSFDLDEMTLNIKNKNFLIKDNKSYWKNYYLYELYKKAITPLNWHPKIFNFCKKINFLCFSSVFDLKSLKILEKLNSPAYKIASFEINHFPLIEQVVKTKKPIILSTGMCNLEEIREVVKMIRFYKHKNFALMKCTSSYPTNPKHSNLYGIKTLKNTFKCEIGLSDHTIGIAAAVASIPLGASIIEKHVTLSKKDNSVDSFFSLDPAEFKNLVFECNNVWLALGSKQIRPTNLEKKSLFFRRSIFISKSIRKGTILSKENLKIIRPGIGLHPKYFKKIIGKKIKKNVKKGTPLKKNFF